MDGVTSTVYDANGQVTTDANELAGEGTTHKIRYEYDSMGRVTKRYNEDGSSVRYEYDAKVFGEYYQVPEGLIEPHWQDGDAANAYRHAMWNALLTQRIGESAAEAWTNAHEAWSEEELARIHGGGFTRAEHTEMDFHNNEVGRSIVKWYEFYLSEEDISNRVIEKLKEGELVYIVDDHWYDDFFENS